MKLISLNTWGGRAGKDNLLDFFTKYTDVDIFCLQEISAAPYQHLEGESAGNLSIDHSTILIEAKKEISKRLPNHVAYFRPHFGDSYGLLIQVSKEITIEEEGEVFVHKEKNFIPEGDSGFHARNIQYVTCVTSKGSITIINFHGLWNGQGKGDSEDRLAQSDKIIEFINTIKNPFILCGDFNLLPETQSLKKIEDFGLRNLVKNYGITSTRTSYYTKESKFADYCLVSEGIEVKDFKVLPDEVSDHSPLYLEFE